MESILLQIYRCCYDPHTAPDPKIDGYKEAVEKRRKAWEEIEAVMGTAAHERIWNDTMDEGFYESYTDFRSGFRLGAALMLELLDK